MRSNNVLGFIFAATLDDKIPELASSRTTASVPIGGKYRIIDFDLSNMSNSGISNVGIVAKATFSHLWIMWVRAVHMTFQKKEQSFNSPTI